MERKTFKVEAKGTWIVTTYCNMNGQQFPVSHQKTGAETLVRRLLEDGYTQINTTTVDEAWNETRVNWKKKFRRK